MMHSTRSSYNRPCYIKKKRVILLVIQIYLHFSPFIIVTDMNSFSHWHERWSVNLTCTPTHLYINSTHRIRYPITSIHLTFLVPSRNISNTIIDFLNLLNFKNVQKIKNNLQNIYSTIVYKQNTTLFPLVHVRSSSDMLHSN